LKQNIGMVEYGEKIKRLLNCQKYTRKWLSVYQRKRIQERHTKIVDELLMVVMHPDRMEWLGLF